MGYTVYLRVHNRDSRMTKEEQIKDWELFCKEEKSFNDGHFYSLLMETTFEDLEKIYRFFPNSEKLILKAKNYFLNRGLEKNDQRKTPEQLGILIKLDFEEKKPIFHAHDEFQNLLRKWEFVYVENKNEVAEMIGNDELSQEFFDIVFSYKLNSADALYAIDDALYGLTTDFDYRLYLFEPLTKLNYTGEYMFQFKNLGGIYAIKDGIVYYSFK